MLLPGWACLASLPHVPDLRILQIVRGDLATGIGCLAVLSAALGADHVGSVLVTQGLLLPAYLLLIRGLSTGGLLSSILSRRPFVILGEASYSMYLFQFPIWWFSISLLIGLKGDLVTVLFKQQFPATNWLFAVNLTGLIVASVLCWKYLETPMRTAIRRNFAGQRCRS